MSKIGMILLTVSLIPFHAFAVDGIVLINQSTVVAQGGFPFIINNPGSYKLSGDLTVTTSQAGNHNGEDIAIGINSSNVTLDLNGFTIFVTDTIGNSIGHNIYGIARLTTNLTGLNIRNGRIRVKTARTTIGSVTTNDGVLGIYLRNTFYTVIEDVTITTHGAFTGFLPTGTPITSDSGAIIRRVVTDGVSNISCPSILVDSAVLLTSFSGCATSNLIGVTAVLD